jgi:hypothetical protein
VLHQHAYVVINRSNEQRKIDVPVEDAKAGDKFVNWLDPMLTELKQSGDGRPVIEIKPDARGIPMKDGSVTITLEPFATAVLTKQ